MRPVEANVWGWSEGPSRWFGFRGVEVHFLKKFNVELVVEMFPINAPHQPCETQAPMVFLQNLGSDPSTQYWLEPTQLVRRRGVVLAWASMDGLSKGGRPQGIGYFNWNAAQQGFSIRS